MIEFVVFIRYRDEYIIAYVASTNAQDAVDAVEESLPVVDFRDISERRVISVEDMNLIER